MEEEENGVAPSKKDAAFETVTFPIGSTFNGYEFHSPATLREFVDSEKGKWEWMLSLKHQELQNLGSSIYGGLVRHTLNKLSEVASKWEMGTKDFEGNLHQTQFIMTTSKIALSTSALGRRILEVAEERQWTAMFMFYLQAVPGDEPEESRFQNTYRDYRQQYQKIIPNVNHREYGNFVASAPWREDAAKELLRFQVYAGNDGAESLVHHLDSQMEEIDRYRDEAKKRSSEFEKWTKTQSQSVEDSIADSRKKYTGRARKALRYIIRRDRKTSEVANKALDAARDAFESQVNFSETVAYWTAKGDAHASTRNKWLGVILTTLALTLILPIGVYLLPNHYFAETGLLWDTIHPAKLVITFLIISIGSYLVRFSSRQYASQQHLYLEAVERQTMLKTYIGLMLDGKLNEESDRRIALETLFRPGQTGIVEDHGSLTPSESVVRIFEKSPKIN